MNRLRTVLCAIALLLPLCTVAQARQIVDLVGRTVDIPDRVEKVILGEGRFLPSLAILEREDPMALLAGTMGEFQLLDRATYNQYLERFPALGNVPTIGRSTANSFSLEQAIDLNPQVAIFGIAGGHGPNPRDRSLIETLEAAGVAILFIDFRADPLVNTPKSIALLGEVLNRQAEAAEFNAFYEKELARVSDALKSISVRPSVFLESRVGLHAQCCETMGDAIMGRFITWAGGRNIALDVVPGSVGTVSIEHLLTVQPQHYVATAIGSSAGEPRPGTVMLGAGAGEGAARSSLASAMDRAGFSELDAVRAGRVYGLWHHFYNTPFNVAAVQAMAKWFHPDVFADLDPRKTLQELYARFQPVPLDGTYWVGLKSESADGP